MLELHPIGNWCTISWPKLEAVWKEFRPYSAYLELLKTSLCIVMKQNV